MNNRNDTSSYTPETANENSRSRTYSQSREGTDIKNELRRHSASSASSASSSALSESEGAVSPSSAYSLSLKVKKTRNKWKESEDVALLEVLLYYSHLLTYVEYFKPMKNFWVKISLALKQQYGYERNDRQCHDRFKVLYAKSLKITGGLTNNNRTNESNVLLLQVKDTFNFGNGNITLKSQPTTLTHPSAESQPQTSLLPPPLPPEQQHHHHQHQQQQQQQIEDSQREYIETMHQSVFSALNNLQEQIDSLRDQLYATDRKNQELSTLLQNLLSVVQLPVVSLGSNNDDNTYTNFNISSNSTNLTNIGHLHPIPPSDEYSMSTLPSQQPRPGPKREHHPEKYRNNNEK